jgi:arginine utilization protein RocB
MLARPVRLTEIVSVSVSKTQLADELHAAERALEAATERRRDAERDLWAMVSRSGRAEVSSEQVLQARADLAAADRARAEVETQIQELRTRLREANERELRLMAVTDMVMARDQARHEPGANGVGTSPVEKGPTKRRSLLGRLFGR